MRRLLCGRRGRWSAKKEEEKTGFQWRTRRGVGDLPDRHCLSVVRLQWWRRRLLWRSFYRKILRRLERRKWRCVRYTSALHSSRIANAVWTASTIGSARSANGEHMPDVQVVVCLNFMVENYDQTFTAHVGASQTQKVPWTLYTNAATGCWKSDIFCRNYIAQSHSTVLSLIHGSFATKKIYGNKISTLVVAEGLGCGEGCPHPLARNWGRSGP